MYYISSVYSQLFHTRYALHKRAYQHKVAGCVELLIAEAMVLAAPFLLVAGQGGVPRSLGECATDMHAYWRLGEYLLKEIENSMRPVSQFLMYVYDTVIVSLNEKQYCCGETT